MQNVLVRKAMLSVGVVVIAAMLAIFTTVVASTATIQSMQETQDFGQVMLTAADDMDLDTASAALKVYQYLETGDPHFRGAYREHGVRFQQYAERFQALARFKEWQDTGRLVAAYFQELDEISLDVMSNHDRVVVETGEVYNQLRQLIALNRARAHDGSAITSTQFALDEKIKAGVNTLPLTLSNYLAKGGDGMAQQVGELRSLRAARAKYASSSAGRTAVTDFDRAVDALVPALEQLLKSAETKRVGVARMLELQQLISATRIRTALKRHADEAASTAGTGIRQLMAIAAGTSLLLTLLALLAGRYVRRAIAQASP